MPSGYLQFAFQRIARVVAVGQSVRQLRQESIFRCTRYRGCPPDVSSLASDRHDIALDVRLA